MVGKMYYNHFFKRQAKLIYLEMKKCSTKLIWLLPEYVAKMYLWALQKKNFYAHVGSQRFATQKLCFYFVGILPPHVSRNIGQVYSSGILDWFLRIISKTNTKASERRGTFLSPNMGGNLLLIFIILGSGIIVSAFVLLLEMRLIIS